MNNNLALPHNYFYDKNGITYRFNILKDIVDAGGDPPVPYHDALEKEIIDLYDKYDNLSLYVHIPWCIEHCSYCHYYRMPMQKASSMKRLLQGERKHAINMAQKINIKEKNVNSIYFGGGTPSALPNTLLEEHISFFIENYGNNSECEKCSESSVITLNYKKIEIFQKYINRLSIGIQSFNDSILKSIGRKHTADQAVEVLQEVVPRFSSVNIDLIYGLHDQSLNDWLTSIQIAIELKVQSITIYRLDIREVPSIIKIFKKEPERFPDESMCQVMYFEAKKLLGSSGYRENLVGWFLLPQVKDTTVYRERWEKQNPCIAFGTGLHNYAADHFYESTHDEEEYLDLVDKGKLPIDKIYLLDDKKKLLWYCMAQWKSNRPVYISMILKRYDNELLDWLIKRISNYIVWKVFQLGEDTIELTIAGHPIVEWVLVELIESLNGKNE